MTIRTRGPARSGAPDLGLGPVYVIITVDSDSTDIVDLVYDGEVFTSYSTTRVAGGIHTARVYLFGGVDLALASGARCTTRFRWHSASSPGDSPRTRSCKVRDR